MNKLSLFATPVWTTMLDDYEELNNQLLSIAPQYQMGTDYFEIAPMLKTKVLPYIEAVAEECNLSKEFTVSARQNPMMPGKNNSPHHHPDCMLAVVYYVKIPQNSGDILLHDPRGSILWQDPQARTDVNWQSYRPYHKITPTPGMLLIVPGYVVHSVETNLSQEMRLSIAISTHFK
jgi:uncharacterized protein (TIGR02466 family)